MVGEQGLSLLAAVGAVAFIIVIVWLLNGPSRRRVVELERRLDESRQAVNGGGRPTVGPHAAASRSVARDADDGEPVDDRDHDADVIQLRPRGRDRALDNLKHELAITRDELLRWRAMSDDFERRWRHEMVTAETLRAEIADLRSAEADTRDAIEDIKRRLVTIDSLEAEFDASLESGEPDVIDLRDRRSDLEDRLTRLAAEIADVRRDLAAEDD